MSPSELTKRLRSSPWPLALLEALRQLSIELNRVQRNAAFAKAWCLALRDADAVAVASVAAQAPWRVALLLGHGLRFSRTEKDAVLSNALARAVPKWHMAEQLLGKKLDLVGCGTVISSCKGQAWRRSVAWLRHGPGHGPGNQICHNACLDACEKGGQWRLTLLLLKHMACPDSVSYVSALTACPESSWPLAAGLFNSFFFRRLKLNGIVCSALVARSPWRRALGFGFAAPAARALQGRLLWRRGLVMLALQRSKGEQLGLPKMIGWPRALEQMKQMKTWRLRAQLEHYGQVISCFEKTLLWSEAFQSWSQIRAELSPDLVSCNAVTSAFASAARWSRALNFLKRIRSCTILPDFITRNAALTAYAGLELWPRAFSFLDRSQFDESPDSEARSVMVAAFGTSMRWRPALQLLQSISGIGAAYAIAITASLKACIGDMTGKKPRELGELRFQVPSLLSCLGASAASACAELCEIHGRLQWRAPWRAPCARCAASLPRRSSTSCLWMTG